MKRVLVPEGWGEAALFDAEENPWLDATRSYDHGGACLAWRAPPGVLAACDMEREDVAAAAMAHRFGLDLAQFLPRWVAAEVAAKLAGTPILLWLRRHGLEAAETLHVAREHGRHLAFGMRIVP